MDSRIPVHSLLTETSHRNRRRGNNDGDRRGEITAEYLNEFGEDNFNDINPEVKKQVERLFPIFLHNSGSSESYPYESINAIEEPEPHNAGSSDIYKTEWINAIEHPEPFILPKWDESSDSFWIHNTNGLPPARHEDFLTWSALHYNKSRKTHLRQVLLYMYAEIINGWNPYGEIRPAVIDERLASHLPLGLKKTKIIRRLAEKYHAVISQLSPGVVFMKSLSDKAERIGLSELQGVVFECIHSGTYKEQLSIHDDLAMRIFNTVKLKE